MEMKIIWILITSTCSIGNMSVCSFQGSHVILIFFYVYMSRWV